LDFQFRRANSILALSILATGCSAAQVTGSKATTLGALRPLDPDCRCENDPGAKVAVALAGSATVIPAVRRLLSSRTPPSSGRLGPPPR